MARVEYRQIKIGELQKMKQLESQPKLGHVTPGAAEKMDHLKHWQFSLFKICTVKIGGTNIKGPAHEIYSLYQVSTYENQEPGLKLNTC